MGNTPGSPRLAHVNPAAYLDFLAEVTPLLVVLLTIRLDAENAVFPSVFTFMYTPEI